MLKKTEGGEFVPIRTYDTERVISDAFDVVHATLDAKMRGAHVEFDNRDNSTVLTALGSVSQLGDMWKDSDFKSISIMWHVPWIGGKIRSVDCPCMIEKKNIVRYLMWDPNSEFKVKIGSGVARLSTNSGVSVTVSTPAVFTELPLVLLALNMRDRLYKKSGKVSYKLEDFNM